jgi:quercetin 2,3-dioxygenase
MTATSQAVTRKVGRVEDKIRFGADAQVDDRNVIIVPTQPLRTDPFLLLSEDWFSSPGFEWHPHRGLETVTMVLDGVLEHGDNLGNHGALDIGDVQWMTAGKGIIHRELAYRNERAHTLQLWVNLPSDKKLVDNRYQDLLAAKRPRLGHDGSRIDLISGTAGEVAGPALNHWPINGALITLEPGRHVNHDIPATHRAFAYVLSGSVRAAGRSVTAGQIAWSDPLPGAVASTLHLQVDQNRDEPSVVMVYSGEPIRQHVEFGGPFVMNTKAEIFQAHQDFHSGKFGSVPQQARLANR